MAEEIKKTETVKIKVVRGNPIRYNGKLYNEGQTVEVLQNEYESLKDSVPHKLLK
jgi:hypothetical protein